LSYIADGVLTPDSVQVIAIKVECPGDMSKKGYGRVVITKVKIGCPVVILSADHMNAGETLTVSVEKKLEDGVTIVPYPAGTLFTLNLEKGQEYGTLIGSGGSGTSITTTSPAQFIANSTIDGDSVFVTIYGAPGAGGGKNTKSGATAKAQDEPSCNPRANVVVDNNEPELVVLEKPIGDLSISADDPPVMPEGKLVRVQLRNYDKGQVDFTVDITINWKRNDGPLTTGFYQFKAAGTNSEIVSIPLIWRNSNTAIRGGDIVDFKVIVNADKVYTDDEPNIFRVKGFNPDKEVVKSKLTLQEQVLAYLESSPKWTQFHDNGFPGFGADHGFGIMKVDPPSDDEQIWNWSANIAEGLDRFNNQKLTSARGYAKRIRLGTSRKDKYPIAYENVTDLSEEEIYQDAVQLYNGGHFWRWEADEPENPKSTGIWVCEYGITSRDSKKHIPHGYKYHAVYAIVKQVQDHILPTSDLPPGWE